MAKCSDKKTPLQRSGTARNERLLPGLQNGYVLADEKTFADWIVFARAFAEHINYYELNHLPSGNWEPFFSNDVSAVLGTIAVQDADAYKRAIKQRFDFLKDDDHVIMLPAANKKLNELFSVVLSFCKTLDEFYRILPADISLKTGIANLIRNSLAPALYRLLRYYFAAKDFGYLKKDDFAGWKVLGSPITDVHTIVEDEGLSSLWFTQTPAPANWEDYKNSIDANKDESIFGNSILDTYFESLYIATTDYTQAQWLAYMKINHAANHNLFAGIFDQFLMAYSKLLSDAEKELTTTLESRNTHPAHYALFLAFLRLFRFAQNDLNTVTQRHLDFYYKEVLRLKQRAALPNSVHILAELAKQVDNHLLPAATLFKAGKDSAGKEVLYGLNTETTFNKATVKTLRSIYMGTTADDDLPAAKNNGRLFAAPMINSADGVKAELTSTNKEWHPIANRLYSEGKVIDLQMPLAEIGFAVASHYLYLQEGVRKIMLRLATDNNNALAGKHYDLYLTTEKEWYKITSAVTVAVTNNLNNGTEACVEFSFTLNGDEPPVANYNAEVHAGTLNVEVPVLKIILINDEAQNYEYNTLRDIRINKFDIKVEVGAFSGHSSTGIKNLLLAGDNGVIDGSKAFQPFGPMPVAGNRIVLGSKELFSKKNLNLNINLEWKGIESHTSTNIAYGTQPDGGSFPNVAIKYLDGGVWKDWGSVIELFPSGISKTAVLSTGTKLSNNAMVPFSDEYNAYNLSSKNGYIALQLTEGFGHKSYQLALSEYLIGQSKTPPVGTKPDEPYTPVIQSLYISYTAYSDVVHVNNTTEISYQQKPAALFHLYPFGDTEQHAFLSGKSIHYLLPQFRHTDKDFKEVLHEGEFYIGFENLSAKQSVNILFQVMDGTADPTISKPTEHIHWSYLSNNDWKEFKKQEISDTTMQLVQSGIISFIIPADATTVNTILPTGYLWIKASVAEKTDAICKLISVDAQAAVVTFSDNNNAADFLNAALPAAAISKLKEPQSAVKKVNQPYSSFGGRAMEASDAFYVRVSERLRHKSRAITIWDYEHLILEAFPLIHKVKCLNHTKSVDADYNEVLPGHVTIITIPDLRQRNDINPLKPYTSQAMLQSIDAFLRKRISCHVKLHVVNPVFEEVQLKFKLKLTKGFDDFSIYSTRLQQEITAFLSPWAYTADADINFGGTVYKSVLINFIEERPYVDFITDVEMCHYDEHAVIIKPDNDEIIASTAKSILVSVPASKHIIDQITDAQVPEQYECEMLKNKKQETAKL